jgi:hypothetical protein
MNRNYNNNKSLLGLLALIFGGLLLGVFLIGIKWPDREVGRSLLCSENYKNESL